GQGHVTRTIRNAIRLGRIHHAFLFTGTRGCGKTSTARILARALNCQNPSKEFDPCNECDACKEITAGSSLDVLEIDGASNNGVDSIRELREQVRFMPSKGKYKIYIVDEVHMLSNAAFNALLKTLEEPPAHVIFIFATTEPHEVPQTILSRCQRFDFKRISPKLIGERLAQIAKSEGIEIGKIGVSALARAAEGSMRDAQSLFDQVISFAGETGGKIVIKDEQVTESLGLIDRQLFADAVAALGARDSKGVLDVAARVALAGYEVPNFARELLARLRDLMVVKVMKEPERLVDLTDEELASLREVAKKFTREEIDALFLMLEAALEEMTRGSTPQLALEMALLRMASVEPVAPLAELAARLEAIASGDGPRPGGSPAGGGGGGGGISAVKGWRPPEERPAPRSASASPNAPARGESAAASAREPESEEDAAARPAPAPASAPTAAPTRAARPEPVGSIDRDRDRVPGEISKPEVTITATVEAPIFEWAGYVSYVRQRKPMLGALLAEGSLSRFDGDKLDVSYDKHGVRADRIREKECVEQLTAMAGDYMRRPIAVRIVDAAVSSQPAGPAPRRPNAAPEAPKTSALEERRQLREEALVNDAVKQAMNILGAELAEVKPVRGPER
ncbi:MAG TPA: DNA polymerase III subunit gamma/tau, partial [bacterium]|nr:DNA polymerase III subunit gamma/tau [bacterium]